MKNEKGFTLIEILVVVLIIGILAAIAVPQYKKAILKTKYNRLKSQASTLQEATKIYMLANNEEYPPSLDVLDVAPTSPGNWSRNTFCKNSPRVKYLFCRDSDILMAYIINYQDQSYCLAYEDGTNYKITKTICEEETGHQANSGGWFPY